MKNILSNISKEKVKELMEKCPDGSITLIPNPNSDVFQFDLEKLQSEARQAGRIEAVEMCVKFIETYNVDMMTLDEIRKELLSKLPKHE